MDERRRLLTAVIERLLPSDLGTGARETGAAGYVRRALETSPYGRGVEQCLDLLATTAAEEDDAPFEDLPPERQDELLSALAEHAEPAVRNVFRTLVTLSLEGFLCRPERGGNRDGLGWRFMGYGEMAPWPGACLHPADEPEAGP